jgi:DNA-binding transcriptional regulator YiaG
MSERAEFHVRGQPLDGKPLHYTASGLDYVYLRNGFTIEEDADYGRIVSIEEEDDLLRTIGCHIVSQSRALTGAEFRFLRKLMKETQERLAAQLHVNVQTVANYEKGKKIPGNSDTLIRMMFALWTVPPDARAQVLKDWARQLRQQLVHDTHTSQNEICSPFTKSWAHGNGDLSCLNI